MKFILFVGRYKGHFEIEYAVYSSVDYGLFSITNWGNEWINDLKNDLLKYECNFVEIECPVKGDVNTLRKLCSKPRNVKCVGEQAIACLEWGGCVYRPKGE